MALRKLGTSGLLTIKAIPYSKASYSSSFQNLSQAKKIALATGGVLATSALGVCYALDQSVKAGDLQLHPTHYPWFHKTLLGSFDVASVRRGYEVYKQVCSACHSLKHVAYRELVDTIMTEDEARAEAAELTVQDGPDDEGKMFNRPGKLSDYFPSPYVNEEAARHANNGAFPPDLTYIVFARHGGEDYIFSLLTGYVDPPEGVLIEEGQYFNPYFPGAAIGMARALYNEVIEYSDGTPATASQMAKDVTNFLSWTAQPELEQRKAMLIKVLMVGTLITIGCLFVKRHVWSSLKTRKIMYKEKK